MKNLSLYRIQNSNGTNPQLMNSQRTLSHLFQQIEQQKGHSNFQIYYHYRPYDLSTHGKLQLKQIVALQPMQYPTFVIYDTVTDNQSPGVRKYGAGVAELMKNSQEETQNSSYSVGENGLVIFDDRRISVLASSVNEVTKKQEYDLTRKQIIKGFNEGITQKNKGPQTIQQTLIKKVLQKLGIIRQQLTPKTLLSTIEKLKQLKTPSDVKLHIERQYSDYDPKFAAYLESIYLKYAIMNRYHLHYVEYKNMSDGVIKYKFPNDAKIVIIGDYGTGLSDSVALLRHAILEREADIIIHLGDVYYAGTPEEFKNHVMEPLNMLRKQAGRKFKKNVLFYSIPGNHDYYTWGLPFLTFIANANQVKQITKQFLLPSKSTSSTLSAEQQDPNLYKQSSSYFCLQSQDSRWQFLGLDTAYHDSNPTNQINGASLGPRLRQKQVQWFNDKMQHFPGSTILLTHHQLFSIHDRICGSLSKYKVFSCINPLLSEQLFKYLTNISMWMWGHQHSVMFFKDDLFGVRKCRLLGNSSFHVFQKEGPYLRKKGFPFIPLIQQDQTYVHKYLPLNPEPDQKNPDCYFNLTYAMIDFSKQKPPQQSPDPFTSTLKIQYWCCPCYPEQQAKKHHFSPYLLYDQDIQPRMSTNYISSQKQLKNPHDFVGNIVQVRQFDEVWMKCQIGLYAEDGVRLSIAGQGWRIRIQKSSNQQLARSKKIIHQQQVEQKKEQTEHQIEEKKMESHGEESKNFHIKQSQDEKFTGRLVLDGDIISFDQIKHIHKSCSLQQKIEKPFNTELNIEKQPQEKVSSTPKINIQSQNDILSKQPILQQIVSLESSNESLPQIPDPASTLPSEIHPTQLPSLMPTTKFEIKKHRILKDMSIHMKYGDAFSLKDIGSNQYLGVHIGIYGGVLKMMQVKKGEQPCLFMFLKASNIKNQVK